MNPVEMFELVMAMLAAILVLHWIAHRLHWPPSIALLIGGGALAFIPGTPTIQIDPQLVLVFFLPPLLMDGAWNTAVAHFRRHFVGILSLAIGAVMFTTFVVAVVAHWLVPSLPWAACAALGAIVSPPDAVSARAVLQQVRLPRRLLTLLEGESLLNDAAGLVLFRFAVAAAMGGSFHLGSACLSFCVLAVGGAAVGAAIGALWLLIGRCLKEEFLLVALSTLVCWTAYIVGERLHVSGVIATVTAGLVLGWYQHVVLTASVRLRGAAFWEMLIFLLEASVFILIGFSLRGVVERVGGIDPILHHMIWPVCAIVLAMTVARFLWIYASDMVIGGLRATGLGRYRPLGLSQANVMGWAGMRGVVTLAVALTLPDAMPGRDLMLIVAFGVILATVLIQGSTLGVVIRWLGVQETTADRAPMGIPQAEIAMARVQLDLVETLARDEAGHLLHPRLLDRYKRRVEVFSNPPPTIEDRAADIHAHYDVILAAVKVARAELVRLHRAEQIDDETLSNLERDLDLEELGAIAAKSG